MLTETRREQLLSGDVYSPQDSYIRKDVGKTITDLNFTLEHREAIEPRPDTQGGGKWLPEYCDPDDTADLILNLATLLSDTEYDITEEKFRGLKQHVAIQLFLDAFEGYDPYLMEPYMLEGMDDVFELVCSFHTPE